MLSTQKPFCFSVRDEYLPRGVRRVHGSPHLYQLRIRYRYDGYRASRDRRNDTYVNFGIYPSAHEAGRVGRLVRAELSRGVNLWTVLKNLIEGGDVPAKISTRWIFQVEGGWGVRMRNRRGEMHLPGPYKTMRAARKAARDYAWPR